ncbi:T9SS type A sorting domain-containing protein [Saprospiraceae bacterium]|nr:T9SS type A sorting domain-containing protein [Saprospiraceae bacterium]
MTKYYFLGFFFFCLQSIIAQSGCTDPQANNYNASAIFNDGSCEYSTTNYSLKEIAILPTQILETSGLAFFDNQLWTHNDAGNEDKIYQIDTTDGSILNTVIIANSDNNDWEDLAEDDTHLYIGDFGNNDGDRMDLKIYKVLKSQLASGIATADVIKFSYSDQVDFIPSSNNTDYDCEAFFFHNDSLHLFSKNWINQQTRHYVLPADPGDYIAQLRETMNVQGLITGADISEDGVVGLLGYNFSGVNIVWLCFDYQGANFFSGNKRKISLGLALNNSQTEAIAFRQGGYGYISSEQFASLDAKLLSFDSGQWTNGLSTSLNELEEENPFKVFPNPFSKNVSILFVKDEKFDISLYDVSGELILQRIQSSGRLLRIEDLNLKEGFYFLKISNNNNVWLEKLVLQK